MSEWKDSWNTDRLDKLVDICVSNVDKKSYVNESPVRLCNYMDVYSNDYIKEGIDFMNSTASKSQLAKFIIKKGDVMITKDSETPDDIGIAAVSLIDFEDVVCGYHLALFKPYKNIICGEFLAKQLGQYKVNRHFANKANGSTRYGLTLEAIKSAKIPYPKSLDKQLEIAKILTTCDAVIEQTQSAIAKYKAIKQGLLHDLFTRGLDASGKLRPTYQQAPELYKESELGMIPKEWEVKRLEECCNEHCSYGINAASVDFDSKLPLYLRITDITEDGRYNRSSKKCVNDTQSDNYILKGNDIVFARTGATVGKTYLYNPNDGKLIYAGFLIKFSPNKNKLNSYFLKSYSETSIYWNWVNIFSQRSGQPGINGNEFGSLGLSIPKISEQNAIAKRFQSIDNKLQSEETLLSKYQSIKRGLMGDLLSGKKGV